MSKLCRAFERATGWPLECMPGEAPAPDAKLVWSAPNDASAAIGAQVHVGITGEPAEALQPATSAQAELPAAVELAATLGELVAELAQWRRAVWRCEAELASQVPVSHERNAKQHIAVRLDASLAGAAEAAGCQSAALYLLDESTTHLKARSVWRLPRLRLLAPPRELAGANADLEALLGHAVVLEDAAKQADWRLPEDAAAAICVPVSSATIPLGTLWVFCDQPRPFSDTEVNLVEIVAGRIAAELERETLLASGVDGARLRRQWSAAGRWQEEQSPHVAPLTPGWQIGGWTRLSSDIGGEFYDWLVRDDGRLGMTLGSCAGWGDLGASHDKEEEAIPARAAPGLLVSALSVSALRAAVRAHAAHVVEPYELAQCVNQTLWRGSAGDQVAQLFYAVAEPGGDRVRYILAGEMHMLRLSPRGVTRLADSNEALGIEPDARYSSRELSMAPDEALLVLSPGANALVRAADGNSALHDLASQLLPHLDQSAAVLAELARDRLSALAPDAIADCAALVLKRQTT
ncbi:MAG TPA: SpoIIE family protein phosphatase [Pirellulales bacterium]|nr:SpoIIE family protein phosphatase [Pirellulales bacterium]